MVIKIGITGITGRMGRLVAAEIISTAGPYQLAGACARTGQKAVGQDIGAYLGLPMQGVTITDQLIHLFSHSDVVIDFTTPEASRHHLHFAEKTKKPMVIGTTGFTDLDQAEIDRLSRKIPLVYAANMTLGIALLQSVSKEVAHILGDEFDAEICEMHHRFKRDAPSGTSLALGNAVAQGRETSLAAVAVYDRISHHLSRQKGEIGFAVMRGGNVFGDHSVVFASDHEVITLSHRILDRAVFARGAIKAALWLKDKPVGRYDMQDVLGLKN